MGGTNPIAEGEFAQNGGTNPIAEGEFAKMAERTHSLPIGDNMSDVQFIVVVSTAVRAS